MAEEYHAWATSNVWINPIRGHRGYVDHKRRDNYDIVIPTGVLEELRLAGPTPVIQRVQTGQKKWTSDQQNDSYFAQLPVVCPWPNVNPSRNSDRGPVTLGAKLPVIQQTKELYQYKMEMYQNAVRRIESGNGTTQKVPQRYVKDGDFKEDLRVSTCMMYLKGDDLARRQNLTYSTNHHGSVYRQFLEKSGTIAVTPRQNASISNTGRQRTSARSQCLPEVRQNREVESRRLPVLPDSLPANEYINSWLVHGSAPSSESHFPSILSQNETRHSIKPG